MSAPVFDPYLVPDTDHDTFVKRLSVNYDNFNVLHPFREGNGRTQRMFWDLIAQAAGWHFDWNLTDRGGERPGEHNGATRQ